MALIDALLLDATKFNTWIALRTDGIAGTGTASDPLNGSPRHDLCESVILTRGVSDTREATADTAPFDLLAHGFTDGDLVTISGVTSVANKDVWNGTFVIYGVTQFSFKYYMRQTPLGALTGSPICERLLAFGFDEAMKSIPANTKVHLRPGVYQTRGFAPNDSRGWQPKTGQKIVGAGIDVTTLQLVGAENLDQHYHAVGMPIFPSGSSAIAPLKHFEISNLTIDCNVDNQPTRLDHYAPLSISALSRTGTTATTTVATGHGLHNGDMVVISGATGTDATKWNGTFRIGNVQTTSFDYIMSEAPSGGSASGSITALKVVPYSSVACGAVRVVGDHCRIRNVKAINWGTKSLRQGCFVISIIQASGQPTGTDGNPIITEAMDNVIEGCIAIQPSKGNARETTVLHIGGLKNADNHAQGFGRGAVIRKNFVDGQLFTTTTAPDVLGSPFSSVFITSKSGTAISGSLGTFAGKRAHFRNPSDVGSRIRFYNPKNSSSRWNGYFEVALIETDDRIRVNVGTQPGLNDDSSFVIMGTEFRAIAVSSCLNAVVEQNQIHNCWIGGPYQSPLDDSVSEPTSPPTLAREERLDPLNALNTRSLVVRDNYYRNVAVGPYFNMGGVSGWAAVPTSIIDNQGAHLVSGDIPHVHNWDSHLWVNARVGVKWWKILSPSTYEEFVRLHEVIALEPSIPRFVIAITPDLGNPVPFPHIPKAYQIVSGTDYLVIEGNQIYLADLDETEFAIKEYPLAANPAEQRYRAYGIVVADNEISPVGGVYAHRQVFIRNNRIGYPDGQTLPVLPGLGRPVGGGMMLAGIKQLHVTHNVLELQGIHPLRTHRCGMARFFHNNRPNGELIPGYRWESESYYDEPESIVEDAFVLSLFRKKKWR